ncbi:toll/interleukin-1 receptor domain-containing protein [Candidatus Binatia bacterium]|nr:toll/interleukin-1 receptor domain-containing protein [Candidatus Binatia bacterium]
MLPVGRQPAVVDHRRAKRPRIGDAVDDDGLVCDDAHPRSGRGRAARSSSRGFSSCGGSLTMKLFLSYGSSDRPLARQIMTALSTQGEVFFDEMSISASSEWAAVIDTALRSADGVVVLVTQQSAESHWVTYEYAYATGRGIPVVALTARGVTVPAPIRRFQTISVDAQELAARVVHGLQHAQRVHELGQPTLIAKFVQDKDGRVVRQSKSRVPEILIDLWVSNPPPNTTKVAYEILADVDDPRWTVRRRAEATARPFLTKDISLYGDVDITACGTRPDGTQWTIEPVRLYDSLAGYYQGSTPDRDIARALNQFRKN